MKNTSKCPSGYCSVPILDHSLVSINVSPLAEVYNLLELRCMACKEKVRIKTYQQHSTECLEWPGECTLGQLVPETEHEEMKHVAVCAPEDTDEVSVEPFPRVFRIFKGRRALHPVEVRSNAKVTKLYDDVANRLGMGKEQFALMIFRASIIEPSDPRPISQCFGMRTTLAVVCPEAASRMKTEEVMLQYHLARTPSGRDETEDDNDPWLEWRTPEESG